MAAIRTFRPTVNTENTSALAADKEALSSTSTLFWGVVLALVLAAIVPTVSTQLDLYAAGLFAGDTPRIHAVDWWWVNLINQYVPAVFRWLLLLAFLAWIAATLKPRWKTWRLPLAFVVVAGILGPGAIVNLGFKDQWQRARPYQVENFGGSQQFSRAAVMTDQCNNNCSFVSGHVACGFFFASLMLVHRRRRIAWGIAGVTSGLVIGFSRMADMAHWLSDVLWAGPITLVTSWLVWRALLKVYPSSVS
jgi:lipid A 4'-phosphatase